MSCFVLTKSLCDEISTTICKFWWAQQDNEKKNALSFLGSAEYKKRRRAVWA